MENNDSTELKPATLKQGALVTPREILKIEGRMTANPGQTFWVTDSLCTRVARGYVMLARSGKSAGYAKAFSFADAERFFAPVSTL